VETRIEIFLESHWVLLDERPEFQVFVRPEDAGRTMGWYFLLPTTANNEAYAVFVVSGCSRGELAYGHLVNFLGKNIEHTGRFSQLRLMPPDPMQTEAELHEWFCAPQFQSESEAQSLDELFETRE